MIRNVILTLISYMMRFLAPLFSYPLLARALGESGFASFAILLATSLILSQLVEFGFGLMGVREIAQGDEVASRKYAGIVVAGRAVAAVLVISAYLLLSTTLGISQYSDPLFQLGVTVLCIAYAFSGSWYYISIERADALALLELLSAIASLVLVAAIVNSPGDFVLAAFAFAGPLAVVSIFSHFQAIRRFGITFPSAPELIKGFQAASSFFVLTSISPIANRTAVLFLGAYSTPQQVAFYAAGERLVSAALNSMVPVFRVAMPRISRLVTNDFRNAKRVMLLATGLIFLMFCLMAAAGSVASPWFVPLFYGPALGGAAALTAFQMLILPPTALNRGIAVLGLTPLRREREYRSVTLYGAALSLLLMPLAAHWFGGVGVASVRVVVETAIAIFCIMLLRRTLEEDEARHQTGSPK